MITDAQIAAYERDGAVIIDGPFVNDLPALAALEAGFERLNAAAQRTGGALRSIPAWDEQAYVDCVSHPFFEAVAKRVLRAEEVGLFWGAGAQHARPPAADPHPPTDAGRAGPPPAGAAPAAPDAADPDGPLRMIMIDVHTNQETGRRVY